MAIDAEGGRLTDGHDFLEEETESFDIVVHGEKLGAVVDLLKGIDDRIDQIRDLLHRHLNVRIDPCRLVGQILHTFCNPHM